ncbi:MAG: hypothetical protein WCJ75_00470 [Desulfomonile sp.]
MTDSKKKWVKPELIILVRSNPAEAVLGACKGTALDGPGYQESFCLSGLRDPKTNVCSGSPCQVAAVS